MKSAFTAGLIVIGAVLAPAFTHGANADSDRSSPMTYVKDSVITTKIKAKLAEEKMGSLAHIKVDTDNKGAVVLSGKVATQAEADKAVSLARETEGVTSVKNNLRIRKDD